MHFRNIILLVLFCLVFYLPGLFTIPALDRDEARFAQASKQMVESGDFVDIRFQEKPRYKKPAGTYWLQALSVNLFSADKLNEIWPYRIPSLFAAIIAVIGTYFLANIFLPPSGAVIAGIILSSAPLMIGEAHMAKSDALLLAALVAAQYGLIRTYKKQTNWLTWACFWGGTGLGVMIKGPIAPLIILLTIFAISVLDREIKWVIRLRPLSGFLLVACICLPWLVSIQVQSSGEFLQSSLGKDLLPKLTSGMESHGLPPGYYLLLTLITFWPSSLFLWPGLKFAFVSRKASAIKFLLAWVIPAWLMFELVPTKLPHYVLPLYPAISILIAYWMTNAAKQNGSQSTFALNALEVTIIGVVWFLIGLGFLLASTLLFQGEFLTPELIRNPNLIFLKVDQLELILSNSVAIVSSLVFLALIVISYVFFVKKKYLASLLASIAMGGLFIIPMLQWSIPELKWLFPSKQISQVIEKYNTNGYPLVAIGYHEPSLIFYNGSSTALTNPKEGAKILAENSPSYVSVAGTHLEKFLEHTSGKGLILNKIEEIEAFNYSKGRPINLLVYYAVRKP